MLEAKDKTSILIIFISQVFIHLLPRTNNSLFYCASHMERQPTVLVITLYAGSSRSTWQSAFGTAKWETSVIDLSSYYVSFFILKPNFWNPIYTGVMDPSKTKFLIIHHRSLKIITEKAHCWSCMIAWITFKKLTSPAIPITFRDFIVYFMCVTCLMYSNIT